MTQQWRAATSPRTRNTTSELSGAAIETSEAAALATAAGGSRRRASSTSRNNAHLSTLRGHELLRSGQLNTAATPRTSSPLAGESIALSPRISLQQKGLGATLAQQVGGSTRRVVSAFAKADPDRQGRIGPADFASVLRSLGVPVSTNDMAGLSGAGAHLSKDTIDYLGFVSSIEPSLAAVPDRAAPPRQRTPIPGARRHYGDHDPSQLAKTDEAIYGIDTDTNPARLHEHAAFAEAAGSDSQKIAAASRHAKTSMIGEHGKKRTGAPHLRATVDEVIFGHDTDGSLDVAVLTDGAAFEGAAGRVVESGDQPEFAHKGRAGMGRECTLSNVDRVVFGHDIDGSEAAGGGDAADGVAGAPSTEFIDAFDANQARGTKELAPAMRSEVDAVVFGRDIDGSDTVTPLTELPEYAGAAGVPTSEKNAAVHLGAAGTTRARTANPNMRATVDEVVFGHDIDGSAAATPVAAGAAFDGAAGLDTDRIRLDELMSTKRHLRPHDDTIESALKSGWGGKAPPRAPARPATADPSLLTAARAIRSAGVRTAASPRMSDVVTPRATATTYNTHGEPLYGHSTTNGTDVNGTVLPYASEVPAAPPPASVRRPTSAAPVTPRGGHFVPSESPSKVLRMRSRPPPPSSRKAAAAPAAAAGRATGLGGAAERLYGGELSREGGIHDGAHTVVSGYAAPPRTAEPRAAGAPSAGKASGLGGSAARLYGGQISSGGGLGGGPPQRPATAGATPRTSAPPSPAAAGAPSAPRGALNRDASARWRRGALEVQGGLW